MPQIRISDVAYRELKERAKRERRTLSMMVEILLLPCAGDGEVTVDDNLPTVSDSAPTTVEKADTGLTAPPAQPD
jgi:hypothetical protein